MEMESKKKQMNNEYHPSTGQVTSLLYVNQTLQLSMFKVVAVFLAREVVGRQRGGSKEKKREIKNIQAQDE